MLSALLCCAAPCHANLCIDGYVGCMHVCCTVFRYDVLRWQHLLTGFCSQSAAQYLNGKLLSFCFTLPTHCPALIAAVSGVHKSVHTPPEGALHIAQQLVQQRCCCCSHLCSYMCLSAWQHPQDDSSPYCCCVYCVRACDMHVHEQLLIILPVAAVCTVCSTTVTTLYRVTTVSGPIAGLVAAAWPLSGLDPCV